MNVILIAVLKCILTSLKTVNTNELTETDRKTFQSAIGMLNSLLETAKKAEEDCPTFYASNFSNLLMDEIDTKSKVADMLIKLEEAPYSHEIIDVLYSYGEFPRNFIFCYERGNGIRALSACDGKAARERIVKAINRNFGVMNNDKSLNQNNTP